MSLDFPRPPSWMERALCTEVDPSLWHPEDGERGTEAKRVCGRCPVTAECLDYAFEHHDNYGIYGGLNSRQRYAVQRQRTKDAA